MLPPNMVWLGGLPVRGLSVLPLQGAAGQSLEKSAQLVQRADTLVRMALRNPRPANDRRKVTESRAIGTSIPILHMGVLLHCIWPD